MRKDGVDDALDLVMEELDKIIAEHKSEITQITEAGQFDKVKEKAEIGAHLEAFRVEISDFRDRWTTEPWSGISKKTPPGPSQNMRSVKRGPDKLVVTFLETGERLDHSNATITFVQAIRRMGVERVKALGLTVRGGPMISDQRRTDIPHIHEVDGFYVATTQDATAVKKKHLEDMARKLSIRIKAESVPKYRS